MNYHSYAKKSTVSTVNHDQIPMNPTVSITLSITISCYFHHYQLLLRPPGLLFKSTNVYKFCSLQVVPSCAKVTPGLSIHWTPKRMLLGRREDDHRGQSRLGAWHSFGRGAWQRLGLNVYVHIWRIYIYICICTYIYICKYNYVYI